ncbi:hypothetical protein B0H14DRAFT_3430136 [Mycena olivaceomarginata]|nr:hypothetical protein B0H14DRAFT_3430136 [Mycena olivaceomarginata]
MLDHALDVRAFPPTTFPVAPHTPPVPSAFRPPKASHTAALSHVVLASFASASLGTTSTSTSTSGLAIAVIADDEKPSHDSDDHTPTGEDGLLLRPPAPSWLRHRRRQYTWRAPPGSLPFVPFLSPRLFLDRFARTSQAAASLHRHPIRLWPAARDYPFLERTVHPGRSRSSLSGGTIVMLRREFIRWKDGLGMEQQRSAPGGGMTTIASSSLPGRAEDDTEGPSSPLERTATHTLAAFGVMQESGIQSVSADLGPLPYHNSLCAHSAQNLLVGRTHIQDAPISSATASVLHTAKATMFLQLLPMGIGDGVSEGAKGSADGPSLLNLFAPPVDGLDACTHEGTGICSPPLRPLDYHMMDDNTTSPLLVRTAFAFTPPVPPAARAFLCAHQTGRVPRAGGRLLRLAAPAFVADDAPNWRVRARPAPADAVGALSPPGPHAPSYYCAFRMDERHLLSEISAPSIAEVFRELASSELKFRWTRPTPLINGPRETHAFRTRRLAVDVWRSYARSRSNVAREDALRPVRTFGGL